MDVLTSLLPGFRSLRTALLTGALLLASLYVLVRGNATSKPRLLGSARSIINATPHMYLIILLLASFFIGSLYTTALEGIVDWIHRKLVLTDWNNEKSKLRRPLIRTLVPFSDSSRNRLTAEASRFFNEFQPSRDDGENPDDGGTTASTEFINSVFKDILWMEGKLAGTPLRNIYDEYRSEGDIRLSTAILLPLVAFATCYSMRLGGGWVVLVVGATTALAIRLASYGLYYYRRAHSFAAHHIADGVLLAPCMETLKRNSGMA
jgi:hypothetical protein